MTTKANAFSLVLDSANHRTLSHSNNVWTTTPRRVTPLLQMKVSKRSRSFGGDGKLAIVNNQRIQSAGRRGTKRFVDPCKVFVGNLPYNSVEDNVMEFLKQHLGTTTQVISLKIIRDWKTGQSKGYGFVLFQSPIHATYAMEICNQKKLGGRLLEFHQGKRKPKENEIYVKKDKVAENAQEAAIQEGLQQALEEENALQEDDLLMELDDDELFEEEEEEEEEEDDYDGVFEEVYPEELQSDYNSTMNREQRREAAKKNPRRKLPHKGFESQPELEYEEGTTTSRQQPSWVMRDDEE